MLSIVVPVLNEAPSLEQLVRGIQSMAQEGTRAWEVIFVDDGSTDASWTEIVRLAKEDQRVRGIRFRRNFGKAAALSAGIKAVQGFYVVTMDADLQDDPSEVPKLLQKLDEGFDVVSGWKKIRHDPWHKTWPSFFFNRMVSAMTGVHLHDHNCGLKAYRREVFDEIRLYGELHRFIPVLAAAKGWRVGEVVVRHHPRTHGRSKYGLTRFFKGFLDLLTVYFLTSYGQRPQHLLGTLGLACFGLGTFVLAILTFLWCWTRWVPGWEAIHLHERALFFYSILGVLLGIQLLSIGFLAELITSSESRSTMAMYSIRDRVGVATSANQSHGDRGTPDKEPAR